MYGVGMGRSTGPPINGKRVWRERLRLRLTQAQLGQRCAELGYEMDQTHISRIENGTIRHPSRRALQPLAGALGLQVSDLQTGDADDEPERAVA